MSAMKTFLLRLPILYALLSEAPVREWPGLLRRWLKQAPTAKGIEGFLENFRERHWSVSPDVAQEVCAYVVLTTRTWDRFSLGIYVDLKLVVSALVPDNTNRDDLSELIIEALASAPIGSDVGVGLTELPVTPPESA